MRRALVIFSVFLVLGARAQSPPTPTSPVVFVPSNAAAHTKQASLMEASVNVPPITNGWASFVEPYATGGAVVSVDPDTSPFTTNIFQVSSTGTNWFTYITGIPTNDMGDCWFWAYSTNAVNRSANSEIYYETPVLTNVLWSLAAGTNKIWQTNLPPGISLFGAKCLLYTSNGVICVNTNFLPSFKGIPSTIKESNTNWWPLPLSLIATYQSIP